MNKFDLADLRQRYTRGGLTEDNLPEDPVILFKKWLNEAVETEVPEPNAMSLATVGEEGGPNVRTVLLKGIEEGSVLFFTNYNSRKARELASNPAAACAIWWPGLERQIRFRGSVSQLSPAKSDKYFETRPRESRIGAWASRQSEEISGREELEKQFAGFEKKFDNKPVPRPEYWGGYRIKLTGIEFWQGRAGRLHDRIEYLHQSGSWIHRRLSP